MLLALRSLWETPAGLFQHGVIVATQTYGGPGRTMTATGRARAQVATMPARSQGVAARGAHTQSLTAPARTVTFDE
jgi:hypothetical protein